jgi:hypothetical protein
VKGLITIILFLFSMLSCFPQTGRHGYSFSDSLLISKLETENPKSFKGKILADYLSNNILKKYTEWIPSTEPPLKLQSIFLSYSKKIYVELFFNELAHQPKFSKFNKWNFELLKKERISFIKLSWEER